MAILTILLFVSCSPASTVTVTVTSTPATTPSSPTNTQNQQVIQVTAGQFIQDYNNNELLADSKYKNKILEITGIIGSVSSYENIPYITLFGASSSLDFIYCLFDGKVNSYLFKVFAGQSITVQGLCTNATVFQLFHYELHNCIIVPTSNV